MIIQESKHTKTGPFIRKKLAEYLGVDTEEIADDDSLVDDLHMNPADISDFLHILENDKIITEQPDIVNIDSVSDLIDAIVEMEEF